MSWPPTDEQIRDIAIDALNNSTKKEIKVLLYWDNPSLMIYDPSIFSQTDYVGKKFKKEERIIEVIIGRED
jgi:hypothetical protein